MGSPSLWAGRLEQMEKNRSYRSTMSLTSRFERCKTPSGSVPISVIMGFDYPLADQYSGRGESGLYGSSTSSTQYSSTSNFKSSNNFDFDRRNKYSSMKFLNTILSDDKNTMDNLDSWRGTELNSSREQLDNLSRSRYVRAQTEARELLRSSRDRYVLSSDPREHPRQQPCRYPTALNEYKTSRNLGAKSVGPMVVSPARHHNSFISNHRIGWGSTASRNYFSSVRSRFL